MKNEFFDPDTFPFETNGFYEEFIQKDAEGAYGFKLIGTRPVEVPDRPLGSDGRIEVILTSPVELQMGMKKVVIKASPSRPFHCYSMIQVICGRSKNL